MAPDQLRGEQGAAAVWSRWALTVLGALVCLGWALLLRNGTKPVTLFVDETMLLSSVVELGVMDYAGRLLDWQVAPMGFLLLERLSVALFGLSVGSARLVPLVAAMLAVPVFGWLVWRLVSPLPGLLVMLGFVASQPWLLQACRAKPYTLDVLFALLALGAGVWVWGRRWGWREALLLAGVGVLGVWVSIPFYFVLAGVGGALVLSCGSRRRGEVLWLLGAGVLSLVSGAVHYGWVLRRQTAREHTGGYMASYWDSAFLPMPWGSPFSWLRGVTLGVESATGLALPGLVAALALLGAMGLLMRREGRGLMLVLPVVIAVLASMARVYPFADRLVLYLAGPLLLLLALGLEQVGQAFAGRWRGAAVLLIGAAMLSRPVQGRGLAPFEDDVMPVLNHVQQHYQPGQWVYLYYGTLRPYTFHRTHLDADLAFPPDRVIRGTPYREDWTGYIDELSALRGRGEVWIVMSHVYRFNGVDEEQAFKMLLDRFGQRVSEYRGHGGFAILWRSDPPHAEPGLAQPSPAYLFDPALEPPPGHGPPQTP